MKSSNTGPRESITWIPAHPIYGAVSMRRYWQALSENIRESDPFVVRSLIEPVDLIAPPGLVGMAARYYQRRFGYPATVRRKFQGSIAHVLDHSWADMLPHLPADTLKVVTVHDLIPLRFPGELKKSQADRFHSWVSHVRNADAVIAVSEYTKSEVIELLGIRSELIHVIPNGVSLSNKAQVNHPLNVQEVDDSFLTIGSIGSTIARKNLSILPAAFSRYLSDGGKRLRLVRVGAPLPKALAGELHSLLGTDGLVELGHVSDQKVGSFYQAMDVIVMPSLYEGFGLPVLESLAHGVPVISSNATSLPEVGGDEALYFDPHSPDDLAGKLKVVAAGMPATWRGNALARAAEFSWRRSLESIYDVYASLAESKPPDRLRTK